MAEGDFHYRNEWTDNMTLPHSDTRVTYPNGDLTATGTVLHVEPLGDRRSAVLLDTTSFHPVDTAWPDQPADRGTITTVAGPLPVVDAVTGGVLDGKLHLGSDLPVRTGTERWVFVVAHIIENPPPTEGEVVRVDIDQEYRASLSAGHTACHLASLALDAALTDAWTKPVATDALGNAAFDALAIQRSNITSYASTDLYRVGKSLRRKGFMVTALDDPRAVADRVNMHLSTWVAGGGQVRIEREHDALSARRTWVCELPDARTNIPCGGTHVSDVAEFAEITVSLERRDVDGGIELVRQTTARPAF